MNGVRPAKVGVSARHGDGVGWGGGGHAGVERVIGIYGSDGVCARE